MFCYSLPSRGCIDVVGAQLNAIGWEIGFFAMIPGMMGMGRSDNYAKGTAIPPRLRNIFFDSIETMHLVGSVRPRCESGDQVDLGGS